MAEQVMAEQKMNDERQGVMGPDVVDRAPASENASEQGAVMDLISNEVEANLQNLSGEEMQLITQLNVPQFRDFMSKVFGPEFGVVMETKIPQPQPQPEAQPQPVSPQGENQPPMTGGGMMQPPVTA
jgi:hypothetical protein